MKWAFIIFFILYLNPVSVNSQTGAFPQVNLSALSTHLNLPNNPLISPLILLQTTIEKANLLKDKSAADYVTFILLWITTLLVVIAPLTLIYLWILYSSIYIKKYRQIFSVKKWIFGKSNLTEHELTEVMRLSLRKIYSLMVGFGAAIIAYCIASIRFMIINFDEMEVALIEYFRFPFTALNEMGLIHTGRELALKFDDFWNQMLLIVVISAMFFLIGYLFGSLLVDFRFKFLKKQDQGSPKKIRMKTEIFNLKVKEDPSIQAGKTMDFP